MSILLPQMGDIPIPQSSPISQPYWDGCARGELLFQRCTACGGITHTPALLCSHCCSRELQWEASDGFGSVYSWTTVWRPQMPEFTVPYVAVIVDMREGWQILSNLVGCEPESVSIGMRVHVEFHRLSSGVVLPLVRAI
jgi:uncharacterized OB-fold protein